MAYKYAREMNWELAAEYLTAKGDQTHFVDPEKGREKGLKQFPRRKDFPAGDGWLQKRIEKDLERMP